MKLLTKWQKLLGWLKKYWKVILSVLGAIAGVFALLFIRKQAKSLERAEDALEIAENGKDIARLEGRREAVKERIRGVDERISELDARVDEETKNLNLRKKEIENMTLEEKVKRFKELGY